jgi:ribosomal protein L3 glutamine methyltransferase
MARICPQVIELGPPNATIHQIDEHRAVAEDRAAEEHLPAHLEQPATRRRRHERGSTLRDLIESGAPTQLEKAGVSFGHGTTNAFDEAAWLVLWRWACRWTPDFGGPQGNQPVHRPPSEAVTLHFWRTHRTRQPPAYLTREAWLQGVPFHVDERAIVPRSLIAELIADGGIDPWLG